MKLYTCKGGLNSTEHYNRTCKANKRNATTKNGKRSPPLISGYKVASLYLIPTINNKGIKRKEKTKVLRCPLKTPPQCHAHRSIIKDYFFNCFSFWQIKNIYVNSALTSQFWYVLPNVGIIIPHNSPKRLFV